MTIKKRLESAFWITLIFQIIFAPLLIVIGFKGGLDTALIIDAIIIWITICYGYALFSD